MNFSSMLYPGLVFAGLCGLSYLGYEQVLGKTSGSSPAATAQVQAAGDTPVKPRRKGAGPDYAATLDGVREAYDVVLNNIAHAQTPGYRAVRPRFREVIGSGESAVGKATLKPVMEPDTSPGSPVQTGRWLDVAIEGSGYLILDDPASRSEDGLGYTRSGRLFINPYNELVFGGPDGPRLEPIVIFPDEYRDLKISSNGRIQVQPMGAREWVTVGQIHLARFVNETGLSTAVTGRFTASAESGPPRVDTPGSSGLGSIKQKHLEGSNVVVSAELAELDHLKQWGESLAAALGVETGFREAPVVADNVRSASETGLGLSMSTGR